ncbi:hypothetical protein [Streptacidiphilus melanogenes]|uniref:hypothetical protein n=1 Tax=Streptacidiphilus melanogenes TaxID=411235 RepID=UPI0005A86031|nr:hypothetical protein [Streptacidiphilus melanogenes]
MIQVTLGREKRIDPRKDPLGRAVIGWAEGLSDQEIYERARGSWVMPGQRSESERFFVVSAAGLVRLAVEIECIVDVAGGRRAFEGRILTPGHPVHDALVGGPAPNGNQQNPITYFEPGAALVQLTEPQRSCGCGCASPVAGKSAFLPGHDQRAIHDRVARVGSVLEFLDWFDRAWDGCLAAGDGQGGN